MSNRARRKLSLDQVKAEFKLIEDTHFEKRAKKLHQIGVNKVRSIIESSDIEDISRYIQKRDRNKFTTRFVVSYYKWQAYSCYVYGIYNAATIMCGAAVETHLKLKLEEKDIDISNKSFRQLIDLAYEENIIDKDIKGFCNDVKYERNKVHFNLPDFNKISTQEYVENYFVGDIFSSTTDQKIEKRRMNKTERILNKTEEIINYLSKK